MLVICALALVVAAAVLLVIGLAGGDVGDLYLSMVLCLASLVVVAVSARLGRVRTAPAASDPPAPVDPEGADRAEAEADAAPEGVAVRPPAPPDDGSIWAAGPAPAVEVDAAPQVEPEPEPEVEVAAGPTTHGDGAPFPIADYDQLAV